MNLQIKNYNFVINLENKINVIKIENFKEYRTVVEYLILHSDEKEGKVLLSDNNRLIPLNKEVVVLYDYYAFDINKYCLNKIYKKITELGLSEYIDESIAIKNEIEKFIYRLIEHYDLELETEAEVEIADLLKAIGLKIKVHEGNILDRIINYINVINDSLGISKFIFINLSSNLEKIELIDLYKYIEYNELKVILVENKDYKSIYENEHLYIIDEDLCEIY